MPVVSVDIIISKNEKILLGKLSNKWSDKGKYEWGLPGREIEFNDTFKKTVLKNLKQETGMELESFKIICINNNFGFGNHYVSIGILVGAKGNPQIIKKEDWKEWKWFNKTNMPKNLFPSAKNTIECFLSNKLTIS